VTTGSTPRARAAWTAYLEGAAKAVAALTVPAPGVRRVLLSGRVAAVAGVRDALAGSLRALRPEMTLELLGGFARVAKHAAQGAALIADGLAGGRSASLVDRLGIRQASGSVLDHLHVIAPQAAKRRLGID
jgi:predicted butyrate kinase (DUF1464 family)